MDNTSQVKKTSINRTFLLNMTLVGCMSVFSLGYLWISSEWDTFETEAQVLRESYLEDHKSVLKREVDRALDFVKYMQSLTEERLKVSIKDRVREAYFIAENIYNVQRGKKSVAEIENLIKDALRPIRFNKGRGYYFAFSLDGIETLFAANPAMEGQNMLEVKGGSGKYVVADMLDLVKNSSQGFYKYTWSKPGQKGYFPKIAFVKLFEPIGWVIGTGEYLDDVETDIKQECLRWISNIKFGKDRFVFVGQWDGLSLSGPHVGRNILDVQDMNGTEYIRELIQVSKSGGGFVHYVLRRSDNIRQPDSPMVQNVSYKVAQSISSSIPMISFAVPVPEWQWYIGSEANLDEIEQAIASKNAELEQSIRTHIRNIFLVIIALLAFIFIVVQYLSARIKTNLLLFQRFFKRASSDTVRIKENELHFSEFIQLAESANKMLDKQQRAEKALRESETQLRTLIENSPDAFIVHDLKGTITQVNEQACKNLEYSRNELLGMNVLDIEKGISPEEARELWQQTAGGAVTSFEGEYRKKDGGSYPVDVKMSSIQLNDQTLLFGFVRDITERKELDKEKEKYQQRFMQAQKMEAIGTLAGGIAHDFNNLLMGIQGCASLISIDLQPFHPDLKHVNAIMEYTMNATNLTKQLLGVARGGKYEVKPIDLNKVLLESAEMFGRTRKEFIIHSKLCEPPPVVAADRRQIEQVLLNLYINAAQAMPEGGELFLETSIVSLDEAYCEPHGVKAGWFAKIVVKDTGIGMDKATRLRIFDPFFTTKDKSRGTGLGLASVYGIIKNHTGIIAVYSEVGQGTAFSIYLPVTDRLVEHEESIVDGIVEGSGTILMVDDEIMIIQVGKMMLEKLGYRVITVDSGEKAIVTIQNNADEIDIVLLDMIMPGMDGGRTFDRIREIQPDMPVLLSSGYALNGQAEKIMQRGCNGFIQKPFNMTELSQKIRKILDSANPTVLEEENHQFHE